ncbi:DUF1295 domain-containing protein, partial [bacterium]|nr:DUF1295 domain-containing protein [bacterium]
MPIAPWSEGLLPRIRTEARRWSPDLREHRVYPSLRGSRRLCWLKRSRGGYYLHNGSITSGSLCSRAWHGTGASVNRDIPKLGIAALVLLLGAGVAWAGSQGGTSIGSLPTFALIITIAFMIQIVAFFPAFLTQSERFYDLTGSLTYISMTSLAAVLGWPLTARSALLALLVTVWAARLGAFLFRRVRRSGKDSRFDDIKPSFVRFLNAWVLQGLWVTLTAGCAWAAITSAAAAPADVLTVAGVL